MKIVNKNSQDFEIIFIGYLLSPKVGECQDPVTYVDASRWKLWTKIVRILQSFSSAISYHQECQDLATYVYVCSWIKLLSTKYKVVESQGLVTYVNVDEKSRVRVRILQTFLSVINLSVITKSRRMSGSCDLRMWSTQYVRTYEYNKRKRSMFSSKCRNRRVRICFCNLQITWILHQKVEKCQDFATYVYKLENVRINMCFHRHYDWKMLFIT